MTLNVKNSDPETAKSLIRWHYCGQIIWYICVTTLLCTLMVVKC